MTLLHMGTANAQLLEAAGIDSREELARQSHNELFPKLIRLNRTLLLRRNPLIERRVAAWINAAGRRSVFY